MVMDEMEDQIRKFLSHGRGIVVLNNFFDFVVLQNIIEFNKFL
jgi:hypothetical protein